MVPQRLRQLLMLVMGLAFVLNVPTRADTIRDGYGVLSDSSEVPLGTSADTPPTPFGAYRSGLKYRDLRYRDVEALWDSLNDATLTREVKLTLDSYASSLVDTLGKNPFRFGGNEFQLIYEYFRNPNYGHNPNYGETYTYRAWDTTSVVFGRYTASYNPSDRSHADIYLFHPSRSGYGGMYPSGFCSVVEDTSTGHSGADVKRENSLAVVGPMGPARIDTTGAGWTHPDSLQSLGFDHEFQHGLPVKSPGYFSEMFSAGAEAIGGNHTVEMNYPMAYTWSLMANYRGCFGRDSACINLRSQDHNYQGRSAFTAYLAYNFRGSDTTATLSGMQDDLLHRWAASPSANFKTLERLLRDDSCGTCSTRTYFHPGGSAMSDTLRLALLLHNWRVANYVNNSSLAEGQYGFPVQFGFSPARQLGAWQANGPGACGGTDDLIIVPPEVTLTAQHATRDTVLRDRRSNDDTDYPLVLTPLGSEYWVIRSDETSQQTGQDLVITVHVDSLGVRQEGHWCLDAGGWQDGRLFASAVGYREHTLNGSPQRLWEHPEWATRVVEPQWTDVDKSGGMSLRLVVPSFGDSVKAVVVVLSMADGHSQYFTSYGGLSDYKELASYRLQLGLRRAPFATQNPMRVDWLGNYFAWSPTFSPDGDHLAFTRRSPSGSQQIYTTSLASHATAALNPTSSLPQDHPDWSPRGDWVAYEQPASIGCPFPELFLYNTVTPQTRQLTARGCAQGASESPAFSPNGQQIAYTFHFIDPAVEDGNWQLRRIDLTGQHDSVLVQSDSTRPIRSPRWSPDGKWIHFTAGDSLYAVKAAGDSLGTVVSRAAVLTHAQTFDLHRGKGPLVFEQADSLASLILCHCTVSCPSPDTVWVHVPFRRIALRDTLQRLPLPQFQRRYAQYWGPRWSYDGTRIAYDSDENALGTTSDVFVGQVSWNHAPQFVNSPRDTILAGACSQTYAQSYSANDPDEETVTFEAAYLPSGATLSANGQLSWTNPGPAGSEHFVVIRALDGSGGVAQKVVRIAIAPDSMRPAAADVVVNMGHTSAAVGWVAPGDDSLSGTACRTRVAYATSTITEGNFFSCDTLATEAPGESGTQECALAPVGTLTHCQWYYFAMKTQDDAGCWSALSNVASGKTTCSGSKEYECSEGDLMAQGGGPDDWSIENSVLDLATTTAAVTDVYALRTQITPAASQTQVKLTYRGDGILALSLARLAVVDHPSDLQAFTCDGGFFLGRTAPVYRIVGDKGTPLPSAIDSTEGSRAVTVGSEWEVTLAERTTPGQALLLELDGRGAGKDSGGVEVQAPSPEGGWKTIDRLYPRAESYAFVVDSLDANLVRLLFHEECAVRRLAWVKPGRAEMLSPITPQSAVHSRLGVVTESLATADATGTALRKGESILLAYGLPQARKDVQRDAFLVLRGARAASGMQASQEHASTMSRADIEPRPTTFALHQNEPNPLTGATTIRFDLPRPSSVQLEIFDLQGRRIATLADGFFPAGCHSSEWNGRTSSGGRVQAGVYVYRLQAGSFRAQRKMVLVQ